MNQPQHPRVPPLPPGLVPISGPPMSHEQRAQAMAAAKAKHVEDQENQRLEQERQMRQRAAQMAAEDAERRAAIARINTPEALRAALGIYNTDNVFRSGDIVDWKDVVFQDRSIQGPFVIVQTVARILAYEIQASDGKDFGPGNPIWHQKLDTMVATLGWMNRFECFWLDSKRLKPYVAPPAPSTTVEMAG